MKKTFAPEILRICYIAETKGEAEAIDLMVEYLLQYGDELLLKTPENMLFIARPAVAKANEILAEREKAEAVEVEEPVVEVVEVAETVETVEVVEVAEIDAEVVIAGLTGGAGAGALRVMVGATNLSAGAGLLQFNFKGCKKANLAVVRYDAGADLFSLEFIKTGTKEYVPYYQEVKIVKGLFAEDLQETFESFTGLYTSL